MADFVSSLNGNQMDAALMDMAEHNSEAWAVGERNGVAVGTDDVAYHNNARYYAQQAQSIAPASVTEAVRWDIAQTALTDANKEMARANIDAGKIGAWSNRNLLDNWYFVGGGSQLGDGIFPINQRGLLNYGAGYTIDRWKLSSGGTLVFTNDGISIDGLFFQKKVIDFTVGETYTLSRQTTDGNVVSVTGVVPSNEGWMIGDQTFGVYFRPSTKVCDIQIWGTYLLKAVKLEKGTVSTLANDPPPNFGEELRKCQRYFVRLGKSFYFNIAPAILAESTNNAYGCCQLPVPMRAIPTMTYNGSPVAWSGTGIALTGIEINTPATPTQCISHINIRAKSSGLFTAGQRYDLQFREDASAYIDFSADL